MVKSEKCSSERSSPNKLKSAKQSMFEDFDQTHVEQQGVARVSEKKQNKQ